MRFKKYKYVPTYLHLKYHHILHIIVKMNSNNSTRKCTLEIGKLIINIYSIIENFKTVRLKIC